MKKTPNKVSTEDLLKALTEAPESNNPVHEIFEFKNDVPKYLAKYEIEAGENVVSRRDLYRLYLQFSEAPVTPKTFNMSIFGFVNDENSSSVRINKTKAEIQALLHERNKKSGKYTPAHPNTRKHFEQFLTEANVKPGNKWVEAWIVLYIYQKWCRQNRKSIRFKPKSFTSMTRLYIESKRTTDVNTWFKIDESILSTLTDEDKRKIQNERNKALQKYKKEHEKRLKVSRT